MLNVKNNISIRIYISKLNNYLHNKTNPIMIVSHLSYKDISPEYKIYSSTLIGQSQLQKVSSKEIKDDRSVYFFKFLLRIHEALEELDLDERSQVQTESSPIDSTYISCSNEVSVRSDHMLERHSC